MTKIPVFAGQGLGSRAVDAFITGDSTEATLPEKSTKGFYFFFLVKKVRAASASPCHNTSISVHSQLIEQFRLRRGSTP